MLTTTFHARNILYIDSLDRSLPTLYFHSHSLENNLIQSSSLFSPSSEQRKSLQTDDPVQEGWHYLRLSCRASHPLSRGANRVGCDYMITDLCAILRWTAKCICAREWISQRGEVGVEGKREVRNQGWRKGVHSSDQLFRHTKPILYDVEPRLA